MVTAPSDRADPSFRPLAETVAEAMQRLHVPGVAVGMLHEGREWATGLGVTSVEHPLPVDPDTLFQIGSITKTVTGTAAMRLVEMGKLDLGVPLRTYLPDLRLSSEPVAARVTLRHVFTHTGGWIGDYFDDVGSGEDALAKIVARMADLPQLTPLGELWSYNNAGFYLAGRAIEVVTGKTYEAAVTELVLKPLGMTRSFFFASDVVTHRFAVGHRVLNDRPVVARPWALPRSAHAAGGIISSVSELLRYARFHIGDGTAPDGQRLLSAESIALMQSALAPAGNYASAVGVTWMLNELGGTRLAGHGGATVGQMASLTLAPERGFAIVVLTNADRGAELHRDVTRWALERYLGIAEPKPTALELPTEDLAPYVGRYVAALSEVEISLADGGLIMQVTPKAGFPTAEAEPPPAPPPMRLAIVGEDRAFVLDGPMRDTRGEFLRGPDGQIAWFRIGGRAAARQA